MSVLFASGFGGIQRFAITSSTTIRPTLAKEGFVATSMNSTSNTDNATTYWGVQADPVFPDRNLLAMRQSFNASSGFWTGARVDARSMDPGNTAYPDEIVFGFTFQSQIDANSRGQGLGHNFLITTANATKSITNAAYLSSAVTGQILCWLCAAYLEDGKTVWRFMAAQTNPTAPTSDAETLTLPPLVDGVQNHLEFRISKTTRRCRIWLNGALVKDFNVASGVPAADLTKGFAFWMGHTSSDTTRVTDALLGNFYILEVDAVHTSQLGPGARVMEFMPAADVEAQYRRDNGRFPLGNYQVGQQYYDATSRGMLTAMDAGTHDSYSGMSGIASQAALVYGAISKFHVANLAGGNHYMAARVTYNGASYNKGNLLIQSTATTMGADISTDPTTNAVWEVDALTNAAAGFQLVS